MQRRDPNTHKQILSWVRREKRRPSLEQLILRAKKNPTAGFGPRPNRSSYK